jgi:sec-independent protein translocase protein TatC
VVDNEGDDAQESDGTSRMSFLEHLEEFRKRILYSIYALVAGCAVSFFYAERMTLYLQRYITSYGGQLQYTEPMGGFMFYFKVGALSGLLLALPIIFLQLWFFIAPGLYAKEKKIAIPFVASSTVLFATGVWFAHKYAIPSMWTFFGDFESEFITFRPNISDAFSFYVKMILGMGIVFQMPVLVFVLARFGIVTAKFLLKQFRWAVLIIFVLAAVLTPTTDPVSQLMFAAPMTLLYVISIFVAWIFQKRKKDDDD